MTDPLELPPSATAAERAAEVLIASAGEVPIAGTIVTALVQIFGTSYQERQDNWNRRLWEVVTELQERDILADAMQRPEWVTAVHDATRIAIGEHLEDKLDMLKAVLVNAATHEPDELADMWTLRYLSWIDELEPIHVRFLAFGADPRGWLEGHGIKTPDFMNGAQRVVFDLAKWPYAADVIDLALEDLRRLSLGAPGPGTVTRHSVYAPWITDRGRRFLDWLTIV